MSGKLILSFNDKVVGEFPLEKESFVIGRRPEADIQIDNLAVSGRHARIMT
ncbi:MAG TPA: FHA domain-containing protein, partial [Gammaproteobacteria bacterium]|nr:FHA domain-containing protein [Gammaproteobacteria bacterium]